MNLDDIKARCDEVGECWIWNGYVDSYGAPLAYVGNRKMRAVRRIVRELTDGSPIPDGHVVVAKCGERRCVSPRCSMCATEKLKAQMTAERGAFINPVRDAKVALYRRAKSHITEEMVEHIRLAPGPTRRIAAETKVSLSHVKAIRRGEARKPLGSPFAGLGAR